MPQIMMRYKKREVGDFQTLLNQYPEAELRSPLRSTVPLLAYWRNPLVGLEQLAEALGVRFSDPLELLFEHQVPVKGGVGKASHTDLMVRTPTQRIAIEAKYTEPAYESVSAWRKKARGDNRDKVLEGWVKLINDALHTSLTLEDVEDSTYQLVHRTASACEGTAAVRAVVYQCFDCDPHERDGYLAQMRRLKRLIGEQTSLRFVLLECRIQATPQYDNLLERWRNKKERDLESEVRNGLREGNLLKFESCSTTAV
jgi:hypothetical protein